MQVLRASILYFVHLKVPETTRHGSSSVFSCVQGHLVLAVRLVLNLAVPIARTGLYRLVFAMLAESER